jgi:hypothetical protein
MFGAKMRAAATAQEAARLLLNLTLPQINPLMTTAVIDRIYTRVGASIPVGTKLFDLTVDLSAAAPHDCPPIGHYRLVIRDRLWLRRLDVAPGDEPDVGANLALFSTAHDDPLDGVPVRQTRVAIVGIVPQLGEA